MNNDAPEAGHVKLERMSDFFTKRLDGYEEHMLTDSGKKAYKKLAALVPSNTARILDLGCGTGLELDEVARTERAISLFCASFCL